MKKIIISLLLVILSFGITGCGSSGGSSGSSDTTPIEDDETIGVGDCFTATVSVAELDETTQLKGFSFNLSYNPDRVKVDSVEYKEKLGDLDFFEAKVCSRDNFNGNLYVHEVSTLSNGEIKELQQSSSFILAVVTFEIIEEGERQINIFDFLLGDEKGNEIFADVNLHIENCKI